MKLRGLILKDAFELWAQNRILIVMIFIYLLIPLFSEGGRMLGSVAMLLLAMLPISALGYDERCKWERYALSMPLQKKDLFFGKLLLGILAIASGSVIQTAGALLAGKTALLHSVPLSSLGALVYLCASLPLMLHLGLEKGRIFLLLLSAGFLAFSALFLT